MKTINCINIKWQDVFAQIDGLETDAQNRICIEAEVIPIVFVPGIMGSRLRRRIDKAKLWDPDDPLFMVDKYGKFSATAAGRKALLIGSEFSSTYAEVHADDPGPQQAICPSPRHQPRQKGVGRSDVGKLRSITYQAPGTPVACSL